MCSRVRPDSGGSAVRVGLRGHGTSRSWGPAGVLAPPARWPHDTAPRPLNDAQLHLCFMSPKIGPTSFPSISSDFPPSWIHGGCGWSEPRDNLIQPLGWANGETTALVKPEVSWGPHRASVRTGASLPTHPWGAPGSGGSLLLNSGQCPTTPQDKDKVSLSLGTGTPRGGASGCRRLVWPRLLREWTQNCSQRHHYVQEVGSVTVGKLLN